MSVYESYISESVASRLSFLIRLLRRLDSSRLFIDWYVGFVLRLIFGFRAALAIKLMRRSNASFLFFSCDRYRLASIINIPSSVALLPAIRKSRLRTSDGKLGEFATSNLSCTAVATLFTFCPPGPEERINSSFISLSLMKILFVILIINLV